MVRERDAPLPGRRRPERRARADRRGGRCSIDLLAFPGHKGLLGPTGTGGLFVGPRADIGPWREGRDRRRLLQRPVQPDEYPPPPRGGDAERLRHGGAAGRRPLAARSRTRRRPRSRARSAGPLPGGARTAGTLFLLRSRRSLLGTWRRGQGGSAQLQPGRFHPHELAALLDERYDIAVRSGLFCAPYAHDHLGTSPEGAVRVSVSGLTGKGDVLSTAAALNELAGGWPPRRRSDARFGFSCGQASELD